MCRPPIRTDLMSPAFTARQIVSYDSLSKSTASCRVTTRALAGMKVDLSRLPVVIVRASIEAHPSLARARQSQRPTRCNPENGSRSACTTRSKRAALHSPLSFGLLGGASLRIPRPFAEQSGSFPNPQKENKQLQTRCVSARASMLSDFRDASDESQFVLPIIENH
jgi:hypothetical protein